MNVRFVLASAVLAFLTALAFKLIGWLDSEWIGVGVIGAVIAAIVAGIDLFGYHKRYLLVVGGLLAFAITWLAPGLETSTPLAYNAVWSIMAALWATFIAALIFARPGRPPANLRHGH